MDFELSEDQLALQQGAADLLDAMATTTRVRQVADGAEHLDRALWAAMADQGWTAIDVPVDEGGLGLGTVELSVLAEQLGRHVAPVPFVGTVSAAAALRRGLSEGAVSAGDALGDRTVVDWLEALAGGAAVGAVAWATGQGGLSVAATGGDWRLSGRTDPVVYAPAADLVVAPAAGPDGAGAALCAWAPAASERPAAEPAMDRTRSLARLSVEGRPALRLGDGRAVEALWDRVVTALCAEMLGGAARVLETTVEYAKDRVQFGRPIGSFQAVKHRCADMLVDVEGMRSAAYYAAWAVGAGDPDAAAAASAAKVWCSEASRRVMGSGLQVHGGIGFTWEHDLHLFVKRAQLDQVSYGDARVHRERLAQLLRPRAEAGLPVL
jgi:alkylation response protein AidB-like acyl-CoA dehydrogenase